MADKCIGNLTLNTTGVKKAIEEVNKMLADIGVGKKVNISSKVTAAVKEALKDVTTMLQNSEKQITETANKAVEAINKIGQTKVNNAEQKKALAEATAQLKEYYDLMKKAEQARSRGDTKNVTMFSAEAENRLTHINDLLRFQAQQQDAVNKKVMEYNAARNSADKKMADQASKSAAEEAKKTAAEVEKAAQAYIKLEEAKAKANIAKQNYGKESVEYAKAHAEVLKLQQAWNSYSKDVKAAARSTDTVNESLTRVVQSENELLQATQRKSTEEDIVRRIQAAYAELTDAIKNYNLAKKEGDDAGTAAAQNRINAAMQEVQAVNEVASASTLTAGTKQKIAEYTQRCVTAEHQHSVEMNNTSKSAGDLESQVSGLLTRYLSLMAVIRAISGLMQNMVDYVSDYSQKMNEIQMITLKSDEEVAQLAERYRDIAKEMNASSLDMADAAIYFTRQGLEAEQIEDRLRNVTKYAKAANVEFKSAAEIVTAVVNSMGLVSEEAEDGRTAAQRVADVFLKIGDNAATSGQEIGEAMQKAAASAGAFGVSMEWLASYIATVSETTRQEARTIGTAFNTIIARLHQIKQTGYNQDDETKVNDIAKALSKIDVALLDQAGNWRDMEVILTDIAAQWDGLDDKTKSYIATTMAGVKQQNVFLALMNDMSKGVENGSRAFELHERAVNSDGTAMEKYSVYLDSVAAAQERLTVAQEDFYSALSEDVIKGWYDSLAGFINMLNDGRDAWGNWTIIVPVVAGAVVAVMVAVKGLNAQLGHTVTLMSLLEKHPTMMAIGAAILVIGGLMTLINGIASSIETAEEKLERISNTLSESKSNVAQANKQIKELGGMIQEVGTNSGMTNEQLEKYNGLLTELSLVSPRAAEIVEDIKNGIGDQKEAFAGLNEELEKYIKNEQIIQAQALSQKADVKQKSTGSARLAEWLLNGKGLENIMGRGQFDTSQLESDQTDFILDLYNQQYTPAQIEKLLGQQYFGGKDASGYLAESAKKLIDEYVDVIGMAMNSVDKEAIRSTLSNMIFGDDGILSFNEHQNIQSVLGEYIRRAMTVDFDPAELIGDRERIQSIGQKFFGELFDTMFGDQLDAMVSGGNADVFAYHISEAISSLIEAGVENADIQHLLGNLDLEDWADAFEIYREKLIEKIKQNGNVDFLGSMLVGDEGITIDSGMWDQLDIATLEHINNLLTAGASYEDIQKAMDESEGSVDKFKEKLAELNSTMSENEGESEDYFEEISKTQKEIDTLTKQIDALGKGESIDFDDLLNLAKANPEILYTIGNIDKLKAKLEEIRGGKMDSMRETLRDMLLDSEDYFGQSYLANTQAAQSRGIKTYREYMNSDIPGAKVLSEAIDGVVDSFIGLTNASEEAGEKTQKSFKDMLESLKKYQSELKTLDGYIKDLTDNKGLSNADLLSLADAHPELTAYMNDLDVLKAKLVELREKTATESKESVKNALLDNTDFFANSPFAGAQFGGEKVSTMQEYMDKLQARSNDYKEASEYVEEASQNLVEGAEALNTAADTWLEAQRKIIEANLDANWAKTNGYEEQIGGLLGSLESGGAEGALATFNEYMTSNKDIVEGMASEYPILIERLAEAETAQTRYNEAVKQYGEDSDEAKEAMGDLEDAASGVESELKRVQKYLSTKYFKDTAKAAKDLAQGTVSVDDAYEQLNKDLNKVSKAYEDVADVNKKMDEDVAPTVQDVSNLASVLGMSAESILSDWPAALELFNGLTSSTGALQSAINALNDAAFIRITGTSDADFSAIQAGLISVQNLADDAVAKLQATGQWTTETIDLPQEAAVWHPNVDGGGYWTTETMNAGATVLKPTGNNPFSGGGGGGGGGKSGGGGGGGRGGGSKSSNKSGMTKVEKMLDRMSQVSAIQDYQQSYYQAQNKYYEQTGQLQGVIGYSQREIDVLTEQNKTLESNIAEIEKWMAKKSKELSKLKTSSDKYEEVADDLDKLQKAHQEYTNQLIDNATAIDKLNEEIEEVRKQIRQMEIDLRNTILKAIEDREAKTRKMLESEIEMENTILDLIKRRYEKERDDIIRTTDMKIAALEEERDLLDEQLQLRRQQAEEEDKAAKLKELEVKYQRIIADPTRAKEAQQLRQEIDDLREEMAWDTAEKEIKAQQDSIDQQITSLEDYEEYINNYYEDLFEHPQKLIDETREIMMMTQEEILAWLKENDEEYQIASENTRKKMVEDWTQMYEDMKGIIKTYWDEVEEIIAKGDDYIIQFLKDNSEDYAKAGKLQAEAYVDEWKKQLEDLKKAYKQVQTQAASSYQTIKKATGSSSSSSGGGGGGSSSGGGGSNNPKTTTTTTTKSTTGTTGTDGLGLSGTKSSAANPTKRMVQKFASGGEANYSGLAWIDGSPQNPERVLSPYQTKLFESMVQALEQMNKLYVPSMPNFGGLESTGANPVSVGDIIVNVGNLDTDEDYEELARKVGEVLMDEIGRTAVIGGLRIRSI